MASPHRGTGNEMRRKSTLKRLIGLPVATLACAALLAGCEEQVYVRGNMPDARQLSEIKPGQTTRRQVSDILGAPSTTATFEKEIWYYIGGKVKTVSFFEPELLDRKVVTVHFDKKGVVDKVEKKDSTDVKPVVLVQRETPTRGKDLTIIQQLIGNLGRFGTPENDSIRDTQPF
jgi:outer membrane protein assembly factor BamE (lipoprotein component of BamABCDE complex)